MSTKTSGSTQVVTHLEMNHNIVTVYGFKTMAFLLINTQFKYVLKGKSGFSPFKKNSNYTIIYE